MFATFDGMAAPNVASFGPALEARVRLFQEREGIAADGIVGEQTILRLNDRLGIGLTCSALWSGVQCGNASHSGWWLSKGTTIVSMILEAMKRSKEGETKTSDVPTVDTVHYVPEPESRFSRWQMGGMLAGVVVIIAVMLTVMWSSGPESRVSGASESHSAAPPVTPHLTLLRHRPRSLEGLISQVKDQQCANSRPMNRKQPQSHRAMQG